MLSEHPPAAAVSPFRFVLLADVSHGISSRHGGRSPEPYASLNMGVSSGDRWENVVANRTTFVGRLGVEPEQVLVGRLSHGAEVSIFRQGREDAWPAERASSVAAGSFDRAFRSDGVVSDVPGLHFLLTFADCVPLAFYDRRRGVVGGAHAGWRGTAGGIGPAVIRAMTEAFGTDPADVVVGVGPSIGPCCYTVGPDVIGAFRANGFDPAVRRENGATYLDLWTTLASQLQAAGVDSRSVENPRLCTSCHVDDYYSHRAEGGRTGRFALCIGRR
ncbi:MAG: laccase domain-containing protein [Chloroflexi bacterium]|nr:laccase domain-containing protein [Chloroflexota bacterium]